MMNTQVVNGKDIPLENLVPLHPREINFEKNSKFKMLLSTIKAVGLLEPLSVYKENGHYLILDGYLRFKACEKLGAKTLPCIVCKEKEAYTTNREVIAPSPIQEAKMMRAALNVLDESFLAGTFGVKSIKYRLAKATMEKLHPSIIKAMDEDLISRTCATEISYVAIKRQLEIFKEMQRTGDYSLSFARALVIKTPQELCNTNIKKHIRVIQSPAVRQTLVNKLERVEERHDFYYKHFRQYSSDLVKISIYIRKLITDEEIKEFLRTKYPEVLEKFEDIVFKCEEGKIE
jgi:uncharacterized ParB-like nuclease family protein